jgi:hypothetical protein
METATCWFCGIPSADGLLCRACMATLAVCRYAVAETASAVERFGPGNPDARTARMEMDELLRATEPRRMEALAAGRRAKGVAA